MSLVLLFPGQGVQHEGMLPWLDDAPAAALLLTLLGAAIGTGWRARLADADWIARNDIAQPLITATSLAAWAVLRAHGLPAPRAVAGYSVGELAAYRVAGAFDDAEALALATARAAAMDRSAAGRDGGLLSVIGARGEAVDAACRRWSLEVAIRIAPDRCLLGGDVPALDEAAAALSVQGAEVSRLRVRLASHTSQMQPAAEVFAALVEPMGWQPPSCVLVTNREGRTVRRVEALKRCLAEQIAATVQWQRTMETLAERRPRCVLEVGAGNSLARLWQGACPQIPSRSVDEFAGVAAAVEWVKECIGR